MAFYLPWIRNKKRQERPCLLREVTSMTRGQMPPPRGSLLYRRSGRYARRQTEIGLPKKKHKHCDPGDNAKNGRRFGNISFPVLYAHTTSRTKKAILRKDNTLSRETALGVFAPATHTSREAQSTDAATLVCRVFIDRTPVFPSVLGHIDLSSDFCSTEFLLSKKFLALFSHSFTNFAQKT